MKIYWSLASVPELSTFPAMEQRRIWRKCMRKAVGSWRFWVVGVLPALSLLLINILVFVLLITRGVPEAVFAFACILSIVIWSVIGQAARQVLFRLILPYVREELPNYCSSCGYNLTGNTSGVCPECGMAFSKRP